MDQVIWRSQLTGGTQRLYRRSPIAAGSSSRATVRRPNAVDEFGGHWSWQRRGRGAGLRPGRAHAVLPAVPERVRADRRRARSRQERRDLGDGEAGRRVRGAGRQGARRRRVARRAAPARLTEPGDHRRRRRAAAAAAARCARWTSRRCACRSSGSRCDTRSAILEEKCTDAERRSDHRVPQRASSRPRPSRSTPRR